MIRGSRRVTIPILPTVHCRLGAAFAAAG